MSISLGDKIIADVVGYSVYEVTSVQPPFFMADNGWYYIDNRLNSWRKLSETDILELKLLGKLTSYEHAPEE
jgi:hypothetical protein